MFKQVSSIIGQYSAITLWEHSDILTSHNKERVEQKSIIYLEI